MSDLIRRSDAIDALWKIKDERDSVYYTSAIHSSIDAIEQLPSAQPERKTGRWIFNQYDANPRIGNWHCSECGQITIMPHHVCNYCPYCGAKMDVEHEALDYYQMVAWVDEDGGGA